MLKGQMDGHDSLHCSTFIMLYLGSIGMNHVVSKSL